MKKLYIDDLRYPPAGYDLARNTKEAVQYVETHGCPFEISFDYNLGLGKNIMEFVNWLVKEDKARSGKLIPKDFTYTVHSNYPWAGAKISGVIDPYLAERG